MDYKKISERTVGHLYSAHQAIRSSELSNEIIALVELYVSQVNGCAYCCSFHANELRNMGISQNLIDRIPGFKHSNQFSKEQFLALEWAEAVTLLSGDLDYLKEKLQQHFSETQIVELTASISLMNALNRLRISLGDKS